MAIGSAAPSPAKRKGTGAWPLAATAGFLVLLLGAVLGWLATQDPLPDALPYAVTLPGAGGAAAGEAETAAAGDGRTTMTEIAAPDPDDAAASDTAAGPAPEPRPEPIMEAPHPVERGQLLARATSMQPTPHPALIEEGRYGLLPIIAADGRESWQVYARPFDDDDPRPFIAVVVVELGMSSARTNQVMRLSPLLTLAFSPYADELTEWARQARAAGHEVLVELPMEPTGWPRDDPGPRALLTSLGPNDNLDRLDWVLGRFQGYVGVIESMGDRFAGSAIYAEPVLAALKRRGLLYLDRYPGTRERTQAIAAELDLVNDGVDLDIDLDPARDAIERNLAAAERLAEQNGAAIILARPYPVSLAALETWIDGLEERGTALAPLTAAIARRAAP